MVHTTESLVEPGRDQEPNRPQVFENLGNDEKRISGSGVESSHRTSGLNDDNSSMPTAEVDQHPDIVDWDGPNDPANPRNWNAGRKTANVLLIASFTFYSNLSSVMFAPAASDLCIEFGIRDSTLATLTVTIYILGFAFGPLLISPLSEIYGRLPCYFIGNGCWLILTVGIAVSKNTATFMVLRVLAGIAASSPMTIGGGTIGDLYPVDKRGAAGAVFGMGPLIGPVIGPVIGGFISQHLTWRWTFWLVLILAAVLNVIAVAVMRETFEPALLERKAARLRKATGNHGLRARTHTGATRRQLLARAVWRPTRMLFRSPIVLLFSLYNGYGFGLLYILYATFSNVFQDVYGWSLGVSGLAYLGLGVGMFTGAFTFGALSDRILRQPREGTLMRPELRLIPMIFAAPIVPIGFFWYGWAAEEHAHWIVPILGTYFIGLGFYLVTLPANLYIGDSFGAEWAASALAASVVFRNLAGTFVPLAATPLYDKLGLGWGNSVLGFISLAFVPVPLLFYKYGESLRMRFAVDDW